VQAWGKFGRRMNGFELRIDYTRKDTTRVSSMSNEVFTGPNLASGQ
jgi:hypothetical protein